MEEQKSEGFLTVDSKMLFSILAKEKWLIFSITILFALVGLFYAFNVREEFVSEGKILPEISSGGSSSLGGLANLVGIGGFELGIKNNTEAIRPDLYPDVLRSTPFFLDLFSCTVVGKNGDSLIFEDFYHREIENDKEIDKQLITTFSGRPNGVMVVNRLTEERIKDLKERLGASIDKKSGIITISAKFPDPVVAAEVASFSMKYLTSYVTNYRTKKLKGDVDFLRDKVDGAKGEFYKDQNRKAFYADQFSAPTIRLQAADVQRERIDSEYRMSSNLYNELLKKYEEAKLKLQQETPVFQVLEPPVVPNLKSEPRRAIILIGSSFIGFFVSLFLTLGIKGNYKKIIS